MNKNGRTYTLDSLNNMMQVFKSSFGPGSYIDQNSDYKIDYDSLKPKYKIVGYFITYDNITDSRILKLEIHFNRGSRSNIVNKTLYISKNFNLETVDYISDIDTFKFELLCVGNNNILELHLNDAANKFYNCPGDRLILEIPTHIKRVSEVSLQPFSEYSHIQDLTNIDLTEEYKKVASTELANDIYKSILDNITEKDMIVSSATYDPNTSSINMKLSNGEIVNIDINEISEEVKNESLMDDLRDIALANTGVPKDFIFGTNKDTNSEFFTKPLSLD